MSGADAVAFVSHAKPLAGAGPLLSGVFWCALGALFFLFLRTLIRHQRLHNKKNENAVAADIVVKYGTVYGLPGIPVHTYLFQS